MLMNIVKKDMLYLCVSLKKVLWMSIILSLCMPMANVNFGCVMPALVCYIAFYSILAYEERSKMNSLMMALPVTRQEICLAKYIQVLICIVGCCILSAIGIFWNQAVSQMHLADNLNSIKSFIPMMLMIALIYSGIILPFIFKFGVEKSRSILAISYIVIFVGANSVEFEQVSKIWERVIRVGTGLVGFELMIGSMLFIISYFVSLSIWSKKEF